MVVAAGPAEGSRQSQRAAAFIDMEGKCRTTRLEGKLVAICGLDEGESIYHKFLVPRDAHNVRVKVRYHDHESCCGFTSISFLRHGHIGDSSSRKCGSATTGTPSGCTGRPSVA